MGNDKWIDCASCWNYIFSKKEKTDPCGVCKKKDGDNSRNVPSKWKQR